MFGFVTMQKQRKCTIALSHALDLVHRVKLILRMVMFWNFGITSTKMKQHKKLLRAEKQDILLFWILQPVLIAALYFFVKAIFLP